METALDWTLFGNPLVSWLVAAAVAVGVPLLGGAALGFLRRRFRALAEARPARPFQLVAALLEATRTPALAVIGLWGAVDVLDLPAEIDRFADGVLAVAVFVQGGLWANALLGYALDRYRDRHAEDREVVTAMGALEFVGRLVVWSAILLLILDNLGFDVTALIAGLGVGGIAVALAVQNILGDLLASISIVLDKPFVVGDFVTVGDVAGTVEHVGLKTTRVRSVSGEQVVLPNSDLLQSRLRNMQRLRERRNVLTIGVPYGTPRADLERIPALCRAAVEALGPDARFDRAHLARLAASSLDFEVVWFTLTPDFHRFMDQQQQLLLTLYEQLTAEGIGFAFPTQTLHVVLPDGGAAGDVRRAG